MKFKSFNWYLNINVRCLIRTTIYLLLHLTILSDVFYSRYPLSVFLQLIHRTVLLFKHQIDMIFSFLSLSYSPCHIRCHHILSWFPLLPMIIFSVLCTIILWDIIIFQHINIVHGHDLLQMSAE